MASRTRRILAASVALAASILILTGCAPQPGLGAPDPTLRGQWDLVAGQDASGALDLGDQNITLTIGTSPESSGRSSCSTYRAQFLGTANALWVRTRFPQYPQCGNQVQQDLEARYSADLASVRSADANALIVTMSAPGMTLTFRKAPVHPLGELLGPDWTLSGVSSVGYGQAHISTYVNVLDADGRSPATLLFRPDGTLAAATACSHISAGYKQDAGEIVIDKSIATTSSCTDDASTVDDYLRQVLDTGFTFDTSGGLLVLTSDRAELNLVFASGD
jgi:heat shock protein HslJ